MEKPIIMQILPQLNSGGVERVTIDTAGFLASIDDQPTYVVSGGGTLLCELQRRGVRHITLPMSTKNPLIVFWNAIRLAKLAKQLKIDLFHVRSRAPAWSVWLASKLTRIPYISTYHGAYRNKGWLSNLYNSAMVRGRRVITISDFVGQLVLKDHRHLSPSIHKIYPGIDTQNFTLNRFTPQDLQKQRQEWKIPDNAFVMLIIGRIALAKRFDMAIKALSQLKRKDVYLVMAGSDQGRLELSESLLTIAKKLNVENRVRLIQDFHDLPLAYAVSDLVLFPTQHIETYGRISAEAGAMCKIVIAASIGAVSELIRDGETGFLVPPGDQGALVDRIEQVLALSPKAKKKMELDSLEHVQKHFSAERMYKETLALYQDVLSENC